MLSVVSICLFFKEKTAYELRISDWSSDVCSSDLDDAVGLVVHHQEHHVRLLLGRRQDLGDVQEEAAVAAHRHRLAPGRRDGRADAVRQAHADRRTDRVDAVLRIVRSEEHTSELQSLMRISYAVFCLKKQKTTHTSTTTDEHQTS